jgi:hypothetical protein
MKPVAIAEYLDHLGRVSTEKASPRREGSPFRPRTLSSLQNREPDSIPAVDRKTEAGGVEKRQGEERPRRTPWDRKPIPLDSAARQLQTAKEAAKAEEMALRLAEAHARGREEGLAEGRTEASERHSVELAAARREALAQRLDFQLNDYARLEGAIRAGFTKIEENVGGAVTCILAPFLVKQVVKYVADELCKNVARLCAGGSPGLITIRGHERVLALLRERIADLPAEVDYVEDEGVEVVVEAKATQIVTELRPWAELLASLDPEPQ